MTLRVGHSVRFKEPPEGYEGLDGCVAQVFSRDYANLTDHDVSVLWRDGRRTNERSDDLMLTPTHESAQSRHAWDAYLGLTSRSWRLYQCSDCDPELMDEDDEGEHYATPAMIVLPTDIAKPDHCPRCGSYLSLDDGRQVYVTTQPPEGEQS